MAQKGNLMTVRTDVKVLDATIRDGGLVNGFYFTDEFVNELYRTNVKAGVDYMEFGYKASKDMFDVNKFGKWKFCDEDDIRAIVGDNNSDLKISVMADVGRCDYKKDIIDRKDSVIDMVRVATYINTMPAAIHMIEDAKEKGYEVTCNIMAISNAQEADLDTALKMLAETNVDGVYLVDSYGSLYPEQIRALSDKYVDAMDAAGITYGVDGDVTLISFDATHDGLQYTLDGKINCDVECNPIQAETVKGVIEKMQAGEDYEKTTLVEDQAFVAPGIESEYATTMTDEVLAGRAY